ncbi:MAG: hypothetical protein ACT4OM_04825 [Actinomycetota bacterium]
MTLGVGRKEYPNDNYGGRGKSTVQNAPLPERAANPPKVGKSLAPGTLGELSDRFLLVAGSELVALYGKGSSMGGFNALLRVLPGADLNVVRDAYAKQATKNSQLPTKESQLQIGESRMTNINPPGGAGFEGDLQVVDQPGVDHDYIFFSLYRS